MAASLSGSVSLVFAPNARGRLTTRDVDRFPDDSLFHRIARAVCEAGCLPRKELFESWEVARRARRHFRGGRIVDFGGGHGLLGQIMLILDDSSPTTLVVDKTLPPSHLKVRDALVRVWPRLEGRVAFQQGDICSVAISATDVVVANHACGALTDAVLEQATAARARVAVLPCCHNDGVSSTGGLTGWLDGPLAIDVLRAVTLSQRGYTVWTQTIPAAITPMNRLLMGAAIAPRSRRSASERRDRRSAP